MSKFNEEQEEYRRAIRRASGSVPWLKAGERKTYRVKVFKSGNSMALRLPAELGFQPGTEMELTSENGEAFSFEPVERPKRKLNVAKFWGIEPELKPLAPEDRTIDSSPRPWDDPEWPGWPDDRK